jgi:hypothetical protein
MSKIESFFPNLMPGEFRITSPVDRRYNCIAWAAGDTKNWWEPSRLRGSYWPSEVDKEYSLESFVGAFVTQGYAACESERFEMGVEKIAIYVDGRGIPSHAARQIESGWWTSKLGEMEDIEHKTLAALEGRAYGTVARIMKRLK